MADNNELKRYEILRQHKQFQNKLFWSRVQTLYLVQAAILGGSFAVQDKWYGWALLSLGIILTYLLGLLCAYDWRNHWINDEEFFRLCCKLGIRWSEERMGIRRYLPGYRILEITISLFSWVDMLLGFHFFWNWYQVEPLSKIISMAGFSIALIIGTCYFIYFWEYRPKRPDSKQSQSSENVP